MKLILKILIIILVINCRENKLEEIVSGCKSYINDIFTIYKNIINDLLNYDVNELNKLKKVLIIYKDLLNSKIKKIDICINKNFKNKINIKTSKCAILIKDLKIKLENLNINIDANSIQELINFYIYDVMKNGENCVN